MKTLERGFKSWSERTAVAYRRALDLTVSEALAPQKLADYLGITLWTPRDVPNLPRDVLSQLLEKDPYGWSEVSLQVNGRGLLIYNPRMSKGRQVSDITHGLAHEILHHEPAKIILSPDLEIAMRSFDAKQEDEANWLAWCLLLPREGLVEASTRKLSTEQIAEHYGVTKTLVEFRMRMTGVRSQLKTTMASRK
jgi:IrrE N-terminal-like domain